MIMSNSGWLLAILLILVTGTLLIPRTQSAMRATSANAVYTTQGPLRALTRTSPANDGTATATLSAKLS